MRDGRCVRLRPVSSNDAPRLVELCARLSAQSTRSRFFHAGRQLSPQEALRLAESDGTRNDAMVALDAERVVALGTLHRLGTDPQAEVTLLVEDAYQGGGLGRHLLERLIETARAHQYHLLLAEMLTDNARMLRLLESTGVPSIADDYFGVLRVYLFLD
jgi:GNAT superfamily N-acetyltransferase